MINYYNAMNNKNEKEEKADLSNLDGKGNYVKDVFYIEESD